MLPTFHSGKIRPASNPRARRLQLAKPAPIYGSDSVEALPLKLPGKDKLLRENVAPGAPLGAGLAS